MKAIFRCSVLPLLFFVPCRTAHDEWRLNNLAHSLVSVLALGVVFAALLKDFARLPRPHHVTPHHVTNKLRVVTSNSTKSDEISTEADADNTKREFGFPSTHTCNAASVAVVLAQYFPARYVIAYPALMGASRIIVALHSPLDVLGGAILGVAVSAAWLYLDMSFVLANTQSLFPVFAACAAVPLLIIAHPHPILAPCPCFHDAIAFISVFAGVQVAFFLRFNQHLNFPAVSDIITSSSINPDESLLQWMYLLILRIIIGGAAIFVFRKIAKCTLVEFFATLLPKNNAGTSSIDKTGAFHIPRFTNKMLVDICLYFNIAVIAVYVSPFLFAFLGI
ncbi:hypothetical protein HK100_012509 [Physocladia obscura]|uniref:Phosphatidic acid phosphatase type 2/haloperoxidase domain-containing protein n=1 Tax=Physocladia obscura TaxID=109957 RepID=A0AAD5T2G0_9FUNG|nr:hypothetical protein HK100_012509 [Physocladia obscura]